MLYKSRFLIQYEDRGTVARNGSRLAHSYVLECIDASQM